MTDVLLKLRLIARRGNHYCFPLTRWRVRSFSGPVPQKAKWRVLSRFCGKNVTWIETGTYLGETTRFLARRNQMVISIEPHPSLSSFSSRRLRNFANAKFLLGTSEEQFETALSEASGALCCWLDGHYSGGVTFQGEVATPILYELDCIEKSKSRFSSIVVLIDDFEHFQGGRFSEEGYPSQEDIIAWAGSNQLQWSTESGIFIARK